MSVNKIILVGNVGKDPETRYLEGGTAVCSFSLATSETYRNRDGEKVTNTEWHNIVLWRGLAEVAEKYVKKGSQLYIEGRIRSRSWDDRDGNKRYTTEIVGDNMQMLGRRTDDTSQQQAVPDTAQTSNGQASTGQTSPGQAPPSQSSPSGTEPGAKNQDNSFNDLGDSPGGADDLPF
jgi:single-strand DNA-binding protein